MIVEELTARGLVPVSRLGVPPRYKVYLHSQQHVINLHNHSCNHYKSNHAEGFR